ncbi:sulfatase [Rubellicoccus peritrichatus]|uniref:Sulfatase n=1 Tax=Rubellicoccus peritrichatus TaxID=3080537 RepID=A0AAQ3LFF1_9BACT|nr:sulfatase [Puniceicoccus sp. CR14]WOO41014.1 sulfatase [Puniceicoccus sp. CR14]
MNSQKILFFIFLISNAVFSCLHAEDDSRPNILFIAIDDLKPMLGCYGDNIVQSPEIDRLAAQGTVFLNNQCQAPICGPSRASLLTGLRQDTTQVYDLKTKMRDVHPDILTLPEYFKNNGYETVGMGKIFDGRCVDNRKFQDKPSWSTPFTYHYGKLPSAAGFVNPKTVQWIKSQKDSKGDSIPVWSVKGIPPTEGTEDVPDNAYSDGAMADAAVEWIEAFAMVDQPFFLAVGFNKPHLPFIAPKKYWDLYKCDQFEIAEYQKVPDGTPDFTLQPGYEIRGRYDVPRKGPFSEALQLELIHGYYACVSYIDAQIGKILDALQTSGVADNTVIVLWGDHGWHLGDHSMWCKHSLYEQAARSPLVIVAPGQRAKGASVASPTEFIDIFPTLCELAGLDIPEQLEGVSLKPLLDYSNQKVRDVAMTQYFRTHDGKRLSGYSFRDERYRYTEWREILGATSKGDGPVVAVELYDYQVDPLETKNFAEVPAYGIIRDRMESAAAETLAQYGINAFTDSP